MTLGDASRRDAAPAAVFEAETLMDAASGDVAEAADLGALFFRLAGEQFAEMRQAQVRGDAEALGLVAHRVAGGSATCGFPRLADALRALEREPPMSAEDGDRIAAVERDLAAAQTALTEYLGKATES